MFCASKRIKRVHRWNWNYKFNIYRFLINKCNSNFNFRRRNVSVNKSWGFSSFLHDHIPTKYLRSIPVAVPGVRPFFTVLSTTWWKYQSLSTQASCSEEEMVVQFLNEILSAINITPNSTTEICTMYVKKLCRAKNVSAAVKLVQSLQEKHVFHSMEAFDILLAAASDEDNIKLATQIFKDMLLCHLPMNSVMYLNLAKAFSNSDDSILLLKFVREASEISLSGCIVVNRIIYAFADCGQVDKALHIFNQMKTLKCKPDLYTYNTVLGILGRAARVDEMLYEFASMKEANIVPDIVSYNTLLNSMRKVGRLDLCLVLLKEMSEVGLEPDLRTYTALIESFGQSGNIEESLRLFEEMKQRLICPSIYIYRSLINTLKDVGMLELAMKFSEEMNACRANLVGPKDFKRKK